METPILQTTDRGLYCEEGDFFVDPWRPVPRAVVTHAHADHACRGCGRYLTSRDGAGVLQVRVGAEAAIDAVGFGETLEINGVRVSLHPAGHILGSAQVRIERGGEVWVVSGGYKRQPDPTCRPFASVPFSPFITEATFALPIYAWDPVPSTVAEIMAWWRE